MNYNIAVVVIAYNRLISLQRCLKSLEHANYGDSNVNLIVSIDKSNTDVVEKFADSYNWHFGNYTVIKHKINLGLRSHVLSIGELLDTYEAVIVLEDDITVSINFYDYAKACVEQYYSDKRIAGISLYSYNINYNNNLPFTPIKSMYDVYMMKVAMSWGQIWMRDQWKEFIKWYQSNREEFNLPYLPSTINQWSSSSWLKYHIRYCIETDKYFVYPYFALSTNNSDMGTHVKNRHSYFQANLQLLPQDSFKLPSYEECIVKYDGFMYPEFLNEYIGVSGHDLTINLYGEKKILTRYELTMKNRPYKIINEYALQYFPWENNIILKVPGHNIFLYDRSVEASYHQSNNNMLVYKYNYQDGIIKAIKIAGFTNCLHEIFRAISNKILYKIHSYRR